MDNSSKSHQIVNAISIPHEIDSQRKLEDKMTKLRFEQRMQSFDAIQEAESKKSLEKYYENNFARTEFYLWGKQNCLIPPIEDIKEKLNYNKMERILNFSTDINPHIINNIQHQISHILSYPVIHFQYGALADNATIVPIKELIDKAKTIEEMAFDVLITKSCIDLNEYFIYSSPHILNKIKRGAEYQQNHLNTLNKQINRMDSL